MSDQERFEMIMRERDLGSLKKDPYTGVYLTERTAMAWEVWKACRAQRAKAEATCAECGKSDADGWALYCVECGEKAKAEPIKLPSTRVMGFPANNEYIRGVKDYHKAVKRCLERQGYQVAFEDELDRLAAQEPKA